jgi:hypothetical protein
VPLPRATLGFYDHVLRLDADGRWWPEALEEVAVGRRFEQLRRRLTAPVQPLSWRLEGMTFHGHGSISNKDLRRLRGLDRDASRATLQDLVARGLLQAVGLGRGARYVRGPLAERAGRARTVDEEPPQGQRRERRRPWAPRRRPRHRSPAPLRARRPGLLRPEGEAAGTPLPARVEGGRRRAASTMG